MSDRNHESAMWGTLRLLIHLKKRLGATFAFSSKQRLERQISEVELKLAMMRNALQANAQNIGLRRATERALGKKQILGR